MSNRLVKEKPLLELPGDIPVGSVVLYKSGRVSINFPNVHPREVCKLLAGLQYDLMYSSFKMVEVSNIVRPAGVPDEGQEKTGTDS